MNATSATGPSAESEPSRSTVEAVDASCRVPLFVLFISAAVWLVVFSGFGLIASCKFHGPNFLSGISWLTYGRVRAASTNAFLYGFAVQAGLGVALWMIARLGQARVAQPWLIALGGKLWNFGVFVGVIAILMGNNSGFENLEMPRYAALIMFVGYLFIAVWTVLTLHFRTQRALQPSQWFLLAALFWFPWIFSTVNLLLLTFPVRGVTQAVINWWYSANLTGVWFGLVGLATAFYFLPKLANRPLKSRYLALFIFWTFILFASWSGIPNSAPVPAWIPALSTVGTVWSIVPVLAVALIMQQSFGRPFSLVKGNVPGTFIAFGLCAFLASWLLNVAATVPAISNVTLFTWFTVAQSTLNLYGFFAMTMFGAIYFIVPKVTGLDWPCGKTVQRHLWCAIAGIALIVLPLAIGGILQGMKWNDSGIPAGAVVKVTLMFLRLATVGEVLLAFGHLMLLGNLLGLSVRYYRLHFKPIVVDATRELKPAGANS